MNSSNFKESITPFTVDVEDIANEPSYRFIPVKEWNQFHPWPSESGLRHLIFHARKNGFEAAIVRVNRRVLINEQAFVQWVLSHKEAA